MLFPECGVKRRWALVPFARIYFLGKCADREPEGKMCAVVDFLRAVLLLIFEYAKRGTPFYYCCAALYAALALIVVIYRIRIYAGICEN